MAILDFMAKAIWSGYIAFGLVNIPVKMFSAVSEATLDLDMLDKSDHQPIKYKRINEATGREVAWKNIVKGFKINNHYVVLEDKDFEKAAAEKTKKITIQSFVTEADIDPIYYDTTYFLTPEKNNPDPYILLRAALKKSGLVGLGTYVLRNREHLCVIKVYQNTLVLTKIHYDQDIRDPADLPIPSRKAAPQAAEVKMAISLIKTMQQPFDISGYKDEYTAQLKKFISRKAKGKPMPKTTSRPLPKEVSNLMEQLKASLSSTPPSKTTKRAAKKKVAAGPAKPKRRAVRRKS